MYKHDYSISKPIGGIVMLTDKETGEKFFVKQNEVLAKIMEKEKWR